MKYQLGFLLLGAIVLSGCATGYGPSGFSGGYSDSMLQSDMFRVTFKGNGHTDSETVSDYALLRAAELTINHGYNYFVIADAKDSTSTGYAAVPGQVRTTGNYNAYTGGYIVPIEKARSSIVIKCFVEDPNAGGVAFKARELSRNLKSKYKIPAYTKAELEESPPPAPIADRKLLLKDGTVVVAKTLAFEGDMVKVTTYSGFLTIPASEIVKTE